MQVTINGETKTVDAEQPTVVDVPALEGVNKPEQVSVQINRKILRRDEFPNIQVNDGDTVEFLYFMGGRWRIASPGPAPHKRGRRQVRSLTIDVIREEIYAKPYTLVGYCVLCGRNEFNMRYGR